MKRLLYSLSVSFVLGCLAQIAIAQEDPGGEEGVDVTANGNLAPLKWEPMITEFFVRAQHGTAAVITPPTKNPTIRKDARGEAAQWRALIPVIAVRKQAFGEKEPVISAWQRWVSPENGAVYFITAASDAAENAELPPGVGPTATPDESGEKPAPGTIHSIFAQDHVLELSFDGDVLMNRTGGDKDKLLRDYFQLVTLHVNAVKVSDDLKKFRDAVPENAPAILVYKLGDKDSKTGPRYDESAHNFSLSHTGMHQFNMLTGGIGTGVWEFRILARVSGKPTFEAEPEIKQAEGAIRVAFVNDKRMAVKILNYDSMKGKVSYEGMVGTKSKGTKIMPRPGTSQPSR